MLTEQHILEAVDCIPSGALREYLKAHRPDWNALQAATVAFEYMPRRKLPGYLKKLSQAVDEGYEKELLRLAANKDFEKATELYLHYKSVSRFPCFPFMEICALPALYQAGDVIWHRCGKYSGYVCVQHPPGLIPGYCDFSDECYYCHDLDCAATPEELAAGYAHEHVHLCQADDADEARLSEAQKQQLRVVRDFIRERESDPR